MVFVLFKAALLLPILPIAIPLWCVYQFFSAINSTHHAFVGFLHLYETVYWGTKLFLMTVLIPFGPLIHFFIYPPFAVLSLLWHALTSVFKFFTFPVAWLLWMWQDFHKLHMHLWATILIALKLFNL